MSKFVIIFVFFILIAAIINWIAQLVLDYNVRKQEAKFMKEMDERVSFLNQQISRQAQNLQETMEVMNREYDEIISNVTDSLNKAPTDFSGTLAEKRKKINQNEEKK